MAPKRAAKKAAAPPPPPPPPAESSDDETRSGSRSRSDESEDEEVIADSPVPAATPALKNAPAPSQKGAESESSEEESDEEEEEEEEEPVRAAPKNHPPPPQNKEDSGSDDEEEEEEEEEEKEEPAPKKQPPPALKNQPPPAPKKSEESDDEEEEEEEEEEEPAPKEQLPPVLKNQPPPAPKKSEASDASEEEDEEDDEEEAPPPPKLTPKKDLKPLAVAAAETKKPGGIQRIWSTHDEVRILEALTAHQKQHGTLPQPDALIDVLAGKLDNPAYGSKELQSKVRNLRHRYLTLSRRGEVPSKEHDRQLLHLSKLVWTGDKITSPVATTDTANNGQERRKGFEEMCELYPYLAEEVKELEATHPGLCKREFGKMDGDKARALDEKVKRQRVAQIRLEMRRSDLAKEVTKALVDLMDG